MTNHSMVEFFDPNVWYVVFFWGAVGALIIVYLRLWDVLPKVGGAERIDALERMLKEEETRRKTLYDRKTRVEKSIEQEKSSYEKWKVLLDAYSQQIGNLERYVSQLRSQIWRVRTRQFTVSAVLFVFLGGATALVLSPRNILEAILFGAGWTSFASLIEHKAVSQKETKMVIQERLKELQRRYEKRAIEAAEVAVREYVRLKKK